MQTTTFFGLFFTFAALLIAVNDGAPAKAVAATTKQPTTVVAQS
jgi:hypothetical protein